MSDIQQTIQCQPFMATITQVNGTRIFPIIPPPHLKAFRGTYLLLIDGK